ncbi:hypothetical protein NDU88_004851 [Pleurodeles waltl]|uniref:Uncharacterized protein n=1 Tax=Pleurodeles waltl TaxID=8319 RepID=A0AAV7MCV2_PLEWA|nr:hypothetical protein NDU88_004851 [Pleurodeles waltl]
MVRKTESGAQPAKQRRSACVNKHKPERPRRENEVSASAFQRAKAEICLRALKRLKRSRRPLRTARDAREKKKNAADKPTQTPSITITM